MNCNVCTKYHFGGCRHQNVTKCYTCGGNGHYSRECPSTTGGSGSKQNDHRSRQQTGGLQNVPRGNRDPPLRLQQPPRLRLPAQARAYALEQKKPKTEQDERADENLAGLPVYEPGHKMIVSSPFGGTVEISRTCSNIEIALGEHRIIAYDLRVMSMKEIDVILGMDWLTTNFATISCKEKRISLQNPGTEPIVYHGITMNQRTTVISALQATSMMRKGRPAYLVYLQ